MGPLAYRVLIYAGMPRHCNTSLRIRTIELR